MQTITSNKISSKIISKIISKCVYKTDTSKFVNIAVVMSKYDILVDDDGNILIDDDGNILIVEK